MKHPDKTSSSGAWPGARRWKNVRDMLHRLGGPAIEWEDGTKMWAWKGIAVYVEFWTDFGDNACQRFKGRARKRVPDSGKAKFWAPGYSKPRENR